MPQPMDDADAPGEAPADAPGDEWYADGLRFSCTQCGNCCSGPPGYVWFHLDELKAMADHLKMLPHEFLRQYAHKVDGHWTLNEVQRDGQYDCVFLARNPKTNRGTCSIYHVRPTQCRTWPFWDYNLASPERWNDAARGCPGINRGNKYTFVQIETQRLMNTPD